MVMVEICIGSACYVKGAREVVVQLNELIEQKNWTESVSVKGCFCMKSCENHKGLGIRVDGVALDQVTASNAIEILEQEIEKRLCR